MITWYALTVTTKCNVEQSSLYVAQIANMSLLRNKRINKCDHYFEGQLYICVENYQFFLAAKEMGLTHSFNYVDESINIEIIYLLLSLVYIFYFSSPCSSSE